MDRLDLENFPTSESAKKMLSYVSDGFYDESYVGKWLFQVMGIEYDKVLEIIQNLPEQFFPETATWGLMYHEIKWGLPVRENLSYEERRKLIYYKRDYRAPMTPYRMEKYLEDATGFKVRIADVHDQGEYGFEPSHPNVFKAYFLGEESLDSKEVFKILDRLKQSHTTYRINDRVEAELDSRSLEQFILWNIRFKMAIPFWYEYVYDGTWFLDGSIILNTKRRYGLSFGMKYKMAIPFWREYLYDGTWLPDGSISLNAKRGYELSLGLKNRMGIPFWYEYEYVYDGTWLLDGSAILDGNRRYDFSCGMKYKLWSVVFRFTVDFWGLRYLDGGWSLDGGQKLNYGRGKVKAFFRARSKINFAEQETVANITTETKTRDYWFLNGTLLLKGVRNLNSIYRKEVAE